MTFRFPRFASFCVVLCAVLCLPAVSRADAQAQMIRALAAKHQPALVTLSLIVKLAAGGFEEQSELEAEGVLLDGSGLVVTTNNAVDPLAAYADELDGAAGTISSRVTSVKIITHAGAEIPAKVVLRDKDLNLAFLRPLKKPTIQLQGVNFQGAATAQIGDPIYLLGRLGKTGNRSLEARAERVVSVMQRPRRYYVLNAYTGIYVGNVAFNEQGQPLGLLTLRTPIGKARGRESSLPVVIPARDIWEVARQAPQAGAVNGPSTPSRPKPASPLPAKPNAPVKPHAPAKPR